MFLWASEHNMQGTDAVDGRREGGGQDDSKAGKQGGGGIVHHPLV